MPLKRAGSLTSIKKGGPAKVKAAGTLQPVRVPPPLMEPLSPATQPDDSDGERLHNSIVVFSGAAYAKDYISFNANPSRCALFCSTPSR